MAFRLSEPLRREPQGKRIAGLCAGMSRRFGWRVGWVRAVWLIVALVPALPGLPAYLLLWLLVPLRRPADREGAALTADGQLS